MSWIGIDVAKHSFTAAQRSGQRFAIESFPMSAAGWRRFCQWTPEHSFQVCLEATGPYWLRLAQWLEQAAIPYSVANPRHVRRFAQASEQRSKTDPIDAALLVRFAETFKLTPVSPETQTYRTLRVLSRRILQLQIELNRERDRLEKAQADPATPESVLSSYAGLDVVVYESGSSVRRQPRISKQGNWRLRRALYLAALSAIRYNPTLAPYYQRKRQQGLKPKQALVAVMRRLLHLVYGVLKQQQPYDPEYKMT